MNSLIKILEQKTKGKTVLGMFIFTNIVYIIMLAFTIPKTMSFSNGMKLLDMMPTGYDFKYVNQLFIALGEKGRETYLTNQIPVDMVYPLLLGISYCMIIAFFLKKVKRFNKPFVYLCFLPIIACVSDYCENIGIISMLYNYPNLTETTVHITNIFSIIKSVSTSMFFIAIIILIIVYFKRRFKKNNN